MSEINPTDHKSITARGKWRAVIVSYLAEIAVLNFSVFNGPKKLHTDYSGASEQIKPLQPVGQAVEFKFESKFKPLLVIWPSFPKAIPEDNRRF